MNNTLLPRVRFLTPVARRLQLRKVAAAEMLRLQRLKAPRPHLRTLEVRA